MLSSRPSWRPRIPCMRVCDVSKTSRCICFHLRVLSSRARHKIDVVRSIRASRNTYSNSCRRQQQAVEYLGATTPPPPTTSWMLCVLCFLSCLRDSFFGKARGEERVRSKSKGVCLCEWWVWGGGRVLLCFFQASVCFVLCAVRHIYICVCVGVLYIPIRWGALSPM